MASDDSYREEGDECRVSFGVTSKMSKSTIPTSAEQGLRLLYKDDAKIIFDDFASRERSQSVTKVDQLLFRLRDSSIQRWAVIGLFRELDRLQLGSFKQGRRGHPSRFEWSVDLVGVGRAAQGQSGVIQPLLPVDADSEEDEDLDEGERIVQHGVEHIFRLRPDFKVTLYLPADFSDREAERLGSFLKTLPV